MGGPRWSPTDWDAYKTTKSYDTKSTAAIFTSHAMDALLNPMDVKIRESRDSDLNPMSTAIILGIDVTGSMGMIADTMVRKGLNSTITELYARKPITDPHVMVMGIGDVEAGDSAPLQVSQFEADIKIIEQLEKIYLEGGGGANDHESYLLPWYFAAMHTSIDCFEKRGKKGYIFTAGDENPQLMLRANDVKTVLGYAPQKDLSAEELFTLVSRNYEVYHLIVEEGSHFRHYGDLVTNKWRDLIGQRTIKLSDHTKMAETIVSIIQINEGATKESVVASWDGKTSLVIRDAVDGMLSSAESSGSVVRFA
jgi:hypothetical protein